MKTFKQFVNEDWKRTLAMGSAAISAGAVTGALTGLGAVPGGIIAGLYYGLTNAKGDLKMKSGNWNYNKEKKNVRGTRSNRSEVLATRE